MRYMFFIVFPLLLTGCEASSFSKDKRQIEAKDEIRAMLPLAAHSFDVTGFREDTLAAWKDSSIKHPIQYTLDFIYTDSTGILQQKTGHVLFTPNGKSILQTQITGTHR
ncbi:MAG: hypothetical protein ACTHOF_08220 [Flavisolibacter sp.]|jgi:hypothetical protein